MNQRKGNLKKKKMTKKKKNHQKKPKLEIEYLLEDFPLIQQKIQSKIFLQNVEQ